MFLGITIWIASGVVGVIWSKRDGAIYDRWWKYVVGVALGPIWIIPIALAGCDW